MAVSAHGSCPGVQVGRTIKMSAAQRAEYIWNDGNEGTAEKVRPRAAA